MAVRFVLVEPQSGGNVGAAARALKNLGFARMVLVRPGCDPLGAESRRMAVEAADVLEAALSVDDLDAALDGVGTVVGTSGRTGKQRRPHYRLDLLAPELAALGPTPDLAVVFGREDHGLTDHDLDRCTHLVHLPASEAYPSFNLAQSVLLCAYELRRAVLDPAPADGLEPVAVHAEREGLYRHFEQALLTIGYVHADTVEPIMRRFRRMLGRAEITTDEVRMLRGLARQILWTAERASLPPEGRSVDP